MHVDFVPGIKEGGTALNVHKGSVTLSQTVLRNGDCIVDVEACENGKIRCVGLVNGIANFALADKRQTWHVLLHIY